MGNNTQQQFSLDPDAFRRSANVTRALSDKLAGIWTELANGADAIGTCWGTDKIGKTFADGDGTQNNPGYLSTRSTMDNGINGDQGFCSSINNIAESQVQTANYIQNEIETANTSTYTQGA
ncbi:hypothetical protein KO481_41665 [Nocardia sp. NEAU-G5]|uniref:Uncharacterized protein n=1 Tax=Nocardia albiluteola TaxID=2842303 RepID=A0ABS6BE12_9NOCA|nr:hypothetical protein [Nocardia albiluteola]MBU3068010.1 hypothetical protein [Nocardia albiluteola]